MDYLKEESLAHFREVEAGLKRHGILPVVFPRLVRGLDYYTRTVFELVAEAGLGSQNTVAAGGRYDGLVQMLGGSKTPALGFAAGIERIALLLKEQKEFSKRTPDLVLVHADEAGRSRAEMLAHELRRLGLSVEMELRNRSVKSQMRRADKLLAKWVMVLGEKEVQDNSVELRSLATKTAQKVRLDALDVLECWKNQNAS